MQLNTQEFYAELRKTGNANLMRWADQLAAGEVALGQVCNTVNGTQTQAMATFDPNRQPGGGLPNGSGGVLEHCNTLRTWIRSQFFNLCGVCPNDCLASWIEFAVMMTSIAEVRDDFSIPKLALETTGATPIGLPSNNIGTTIFNAAFPVQPGHSILLKVQPYAFPFNPQCLWGVLGFSGGDIEANYDHVLFKAWVGPKVLPAAFSMQDGTLKEWNPKQWIFGSQFRCGTRCQEVALRSFTGCTDADIVGLNSTLYIQIDNQSTASNNISGQQMVLHLGGFERPCCGSCAHGKTCESGCPSKQENHQH